LINNKDFITSHVGDTRIYTFIQDEWKYFRIILSPTHESGRWMYSIQSIFLSDKENKERLHSYRNAVLKLPEWQRELYTVLPDFTEQCRAIEEKLNQEWKIIAQSKQPSQSIAALPAVSRAGTEASESATIPPEGKTFSIPPKRFVVMEISNNDTNSQHNFHPVSPAAWTKEISKIIAEHDYLITVNTDGALTRIIANSYTRGPIAELVIETHSDGTGLTIHPPKQLGSLDLYQPLIDKIMARIGSIAYEAHKSSQPKATAQKPNTKGSDHYAHPNPKTREEIVVHYRKERAAGNVSNKDTWAQSNYGIVGKTLKRYEDEFDRKIDT
jgi:hypothetical protein